MRKLIFTLLMAFMTVIGVNAQEKTVINEEKVFDNTYIGVQAGAFTNMDFNKVFPLNSTVGVRLGKNFTPVFGLNAEGIVTFGSATNSTMGQFDKRFDSPAGHNIVRAVNVGVNTTFNLTNLFLGYNGSPRSFEIETVTGLGWYHKYAPSMYSTDNDGLSAKTAVDFMFNVGKSKASVFYIEPAVMWVLKTSYSTAVEFNKHDAFVGVNVGYIYKFKTSNGTHNFVKSKLYDQAEIDRLNAQIADMKANPQVVEKVVTVNTPVTVNPFTVSFAKGKSDLTDAAKKVLDTIDAKSTVRVIGSASPEGKVSFNKTLSQERAETVAKYLESKGVTITTAEGVGSQDATSQRIVNVIAK